MDIDGDPCTVEFSRSARRLARRAALTLLVLVVVSAVVSLARGRQWWDMLWLLPGYFSAFFVSAFSARTPAAGLRSRVLVRLNRQELELAGPEDTTVAVDWSNVARAEIHGRHTPFLVVEPVDPGLTRPPLRRWQMAGHGQSRPYEVRVPLADMSPGRDVLRRELARRLPGDAPGPPPGA
ncbi:hypothetical protein [Micromonospora sp. KLBMP9576]|uniref:hypothetical protein n=1 Tax=Micromonospora sp. KLBMP9576 TaxID=3424769 RepID=UPI003D943DD9